MKVTKATTGGAAEAHHAHLDVTMMIATKSRQFNPLALTRFELMMDPSRSAADIDLGRPVIIESFERTSATRKKFFPARQIHMPGLALAID